MPNRTFLLHGRIIERIQCALCLGFLIKFSSLTPECPYKTAILVPKARRQPPQAGDRTAVELVFPIPTSQEPWAGLPS